DRAGERAALRDDVLGSGVVALPPAHRCGSSCCPRGNCFPHHGARALGYCPSYCRCRGSGRQDGCLSACAAVSRMQVGEKELTVLQRANTVRVQVDVMHLVSTEEMISTCS